ncbi:alpha/beta hydrolase [Aeromicrobium sp. CF4.19]|uniref:alpha/beta hydrolase n=1 Tax=Aeromicrobium sp. CF4.19 TaxID=3373082 RepID=UPI003EE6FEA8
MGDWQADVLGDGYEQQTIDLGDDPDDEGEIVATIVRRAWTGAKAPERAVLYVHGFSDYFFQRELAEFYADRGFAFYALDLRKCGRSRRADQTAHYVSDLALYDAELDRALAIVRQECDDAPVLLSAHSTGGLVLPLWLHRMNEQDGGSQGAGVSGLVLNSPWFDLQGQAWMRSVGTQVIGAVARVRPLRVLDLPPTDAYGTSLSATGRGEWEYELDWKPLAGFPVTLGWLTAVRAGHARLHRGLDIGVPSLVLRSDKSHLSRTWKDRTDVSDAVLDVKQIARWSGCLGDAVWSIPIPDARHDVFLSLDGPRKLAYETVDAWLRFHDLTG